MLRRISPDVHRRLTQRRKQQFPVSTPMVTGAFTLEKICLFGYIQ
jgi:hypothetical protein